MYCVCSVFIIITMRVYIIYFFLLNLCLVLQLTVDLPTSKWLDTGNAMILTSITCTCFVYTGRTRVNPWKFRELTKSSVSYTKNCVLIILWPNCIGK